MATKKRHLSPGDVLFRAGDQPDCAYLVESGSLEVQSEQDGKVIVLGHIKTGDLLGEMAVIDNEARTATVVANTSCVLLEIDREQFAERLIKSDPIIRSLLEGLLKRYRATLSRITGEELDENFDETTILERITVEKIRLESQLREALSNNGLDVRYQPLLDIANNKIAGYEALVRWNHPEHGFISPAEFVALAEETSLILEVGEYVIETACAAVKSFIDAGANPKPFIAVNVSAKQLAHPGLIERIVERVDNAGLPKGSLKIEITESQALIFEEVKNTIDLCHEHGMKVALDDFGTGYSNLTQLHKLDFDTVKIDQAFTRGMEEDPRSMVLVDTIVHMSEALGADVLVEGIENEHMLEILRELKCKYAQGYHIGKPQPLDEILAKL